MSFIKWFVSGLVMECLFLSMLSPAITMAQTLKTFDQTARPAEGSLVPKYRPGEILVTFKEDKIDLKSTDGKNKVK